MAGEGEVLKAKLWQHTQHHHGSDMMTGTGRCVGSIASIAAATIFTFVLSYPLAASSCGLEPTINGGFSVSYPGSLDVAVAVAKARREGLLPEMGQSSHSLPNALRLQEMLADLQRLQARLNDGRVGNSANDSIPFSLVLVGPGLWSQFHVAADGVQANYHTNGPVAGTVVVLTHHVALRAMLSGDLSIEQATEHGLIKYSGGDITPVQQTFKYSFQSKA